MAPKDFVYVVIEKNDEGGVATVEAYSSNDNAKAAVKEYKSNGSSNVDITKVELKSSTDATAPKGGKAKAAANTKAKTTKKAKPAEPEEDDENDEANDAEEDASKPMKTSGKNDGSRQAIPEGKANALKGLKVLFTGTFDIDRKTSEATAVTYGAQVIKKLEDTDYVILGTRPGQKKVDTIEANGLDTISENEFYKMLKTGVPKEKRDQMAAKAESAAETEPAKKKQKK